MVAVGVRVRSSSAIAVINSTAAIPHRSVCWLVVAALAVVARLAVHREALRAARMAEADRRVVAMMDAALRPARVPAPEAVRPVAVVHLAAVIPIAAALPVVHLVVVRREAALPVHRRPVALPPAGPAPAVVASVLRLERSTDIAVFGNRQLSPMQRPAKRTPNARSMSPATFTTADRRIPTRSSPHTMATHAPRPTRR
jgi:hypothetical protein